MKVEARELMRNKESTLPGLMVNPYFLQWTLANIKEDLH